jgi:proteasome lid subunit RPN8/RPN11
MAKRSLHQDERPPLPPDGTVERIEEVVVDKSTLAGFKRRALRKYPNEYIENIWGVVDDGTARIVVFRKIDHTATAESIVYDVDEDDGSEPGLRLLGTIHTHPDGIALLSEDDIESILENNERLSGVLAITKRGKRRLSSINFFSLTETPIPLVISEENSS